MRAKEFNHLLGSVKQAGKIRRGRMKTVRVHTPGDTYQLMAQLRKSANRARRNLRELINGNKSALTLLIQLKFQQIGCDPLDPDRPLNLIEQLNQLCTYMATFQAAAWLLDRHPEHAPFELNLGTVAGFDIESQDHQLIAEVFAAVDPRNNDKLQKDKNKLRDQVARFKYVLYLSATTGGKPEEFESDGVQVRRIQALEM